MPEVLGEPPSPRTALFWNGTAWQWALVDAAGHLQLDVVTSGLPAGAATEATLASADGYLGLLAVLWNCLRTVGTDRFMVKGEDQLFSFKGVLSFRTSGAIVWPATTFASTLVPAGEIWVVTNAYTVNETTAVSRIQFRNHHDGADSYMHEEIRAFGIGEATQWAGMVTLDVGDSIEARFVGAAAGDQIILDLNGYRMTVET